MDRFLVHADKALRKRVMIGFVATILLGALRRGVVLGRVRVVALASVLDDAEIEGLPSVVLGKPFSRAMFSRLALQSRADVPHPSPSHVPVHLVEDARLLVAEDDPTNVLVFRLFFEELGVRPEIVGNGRLALDRVEAAEHFDLVLLDGEMPEMDGRETAQRIRAFEKAAGALRVPIIGVSAHTLDDQRRDALGSGMDGYLTKPLTLDSFVAAIREHAPGLVREGRAPKLSRKATPIPVSGSTSELADVFERSTQEALALLQGAAERSDWAACGTHAHRLKGACLVLGAKGGADLAADVERLAKEHDSAGLMGAVVALEIELADAAHVMRSASEAPERVAS